MADPRFKRGARRAPMHKLLKVPVFRPHKVPPIFVVWLPTQYDVFNNSTIGDCVTAEEGASKSAAEGKYWIDPAVVVQWAVDHGWDNGADLPQVLDAMQSGGFKVGSQLYNDGPYSTVDYSNESTLQAAVAIGPVKVAIDANALPQGAGNQQGWSAFGGSPGQYSNTDHCVAVWGYGSTALLAQRLGVPVPSGAPANGYLVYTWATVGIVDHAWLMSTVVEAYVRNPTTVGVPPLGPPTPPTPPVPPIPPIPPVPPPPPPAVGWTVTIPQTVIQVQGSAPAGAVPPWLLPILKALCSMLPPG